MKTCTSLDHKNEKYSKPLSGVFRGTPEYSDFTKKTQSSTRNHQRGFHSGEKICNWRIKFIVISKKGFFVHVCQKGENCPCASLCRPEFGDQIKDPTVLSRREKNRTPWREKKKLRKKYYAGSRGSGPMWYRGKIINWGGGLDQHTCKKPPNWNQWKMLHPPPREKKTRVFLLFCVFLFFVSYYFVVHNPVQPTPSRLSVCRSPSSSSRKTNFSRQLMCIYISAWKKRLISNGYFEMNYWRGCYSYC